MTIKPFPVSQIPKLETDGCSVEVLLESHAGFYVGYYYRGNWYESIYCETMHRQFEPWQWYPLPTRAQKLNGD